MPDSGFVFYFRQYFGFLLALVSGSLLLFGYDKGWMHNNTLSLVSLGIMLVGLLVHELRPFKVRWARAGADGQGSATEWLGFEI